MYDYLVVGSGLYGATFAHEAHQHGKSVLVIDKRPSIAGNIYTEKVEGINFHKYGAHIFHTNNKTVWDYLCNDMVDNFDVYLAYSLRPQTPKNYKDFLDKHVHLIQVKSFGEKGLTSIPNKGWRYKGRKRA